VAKRKSKDGARKKSVSRESGRAAFSLSSWQTLALILAGGFILHVSALTAPFFADDYVFLDHVRFQSFTKTLFSPDPLGNFFRPVGRQVYFWLNAHIGNESPIFFHSVNMCLFLLSLALLFFIARRLAGQMAGVIAAGVLALHYASDVPILWASGSQDLLALAGALAAIQLFLVRRPVLSAVAFLTALLCKETVVVTPLVAMLLSRTETHSWKKAGLRALPLFVVLIPWAILWLSFGSQEVAPGVQLTLSAGGFAAAFVQLARVTLGLEWPTGAFGSQWAILPPLLALVPLAVAAIWTRQPSKHPAYSLVPGLGWTLLGALPVALVAAIWSAYYYLFAVAGVALVLGTWASRFPRWVAVLLLVTVGWTSQAARNIDEFASGPGAWSAQSHMNGWWFGRGARVVQSYMKDLKEACPTVPEGSTFFFFAIPAFTVWHSGPLVRWAYRDSSLDAHYISNFSLENVGQGPVLFFRGDGDRLVETLTEDEALLHLAAIMLLQNNLEATRDAVLLEMRSRPDSKTALYWLGWLEWAQGDTVSATRLLRQSGVVPRGGPTPDMSTAAALAHSGSLEQAVELMTAAVREHELDPKAQALLSDLLALNRRFLPATFISAFAARVLTPEDPTVWRRWGRLQYNARLHAEAGVSLEKYVALGGADDAEDEQARRILEDIPDILPGGDRVQEQLHEDPLKKRP